MRRRRELLVKVRHSGSSTAKAPSHAFKISRKVGHAFCGAFEASRFIPELVREPGRKVAKVELGMGGGCIEEELPQVVGVMLNLFCELSCVVHGVSGSYVARSAVAGMAGLPETGV